MLTRITIEIKMKIQTYKKLLSMAQKIKGMCVTAICLLALGIMVAPCFLAFSQGADGELTWMNVVGVAWIGLLFGVFKFKSR